MEEALFLGFVTVQELPDRYGDAYKKRVGNLAAEEIEASIDSALQGKTCLRQLHIDTAAITFGSLYRSLLHVRGTLEQLKMDISGDVPWSFLCKVFASCPRLRSLQLSCGVLVGEFPSDVVLHGLLYLSVKPLESYRYVSVLSLGAISALVKSVRSLETLIVGELCGGERATGATDKGHLTLKQNGARIVVESERLKHLCLHRGNMIEIELRAPNLETLRIKGYGACVVHSTLDKLANLEHETIGSMSSLDFRCAPPPSLKSVVLHFGHNDRPKVDALVFDNVENLFCPLHGMESLLAKCGANVRILGLIDWVSSYGRIEIDKLVKSCQSLEKIYTECRCRSLEELSITSDAIPPDTKPCMQMYWRACDFCDGECDLNGPSVDVNQDGVSKPTLSSVVFHEVDARDWPAVSSASSEDMNIDIDLSMISDEDWRHCNVYDVEISTVKRSARALVASFYFTGCLPQDMSSSVIAYLRKDMPPNSLVLPAKDEDVEQLLQHFADAVSDDEDVYDRKSLKLDARHFLSSFEPSSCGILDEMRKCFSTDLNIVLDKLNVYRPGDFFKAHRVPPRDGLLGSLLVVLPGDHTGGELLVRNEGVEHCLRIQDSTKIYWAAFCSDCEHEMKELTSGFRLTLTYNLYRSRKRPSPSSAELFDATSLPIYHELTRLKKMGINESVLLGVACRCSYPFSRGEAERTSEEMAGMLKGEDAVVFAAAKAAGLKPAVVQVWKCRHKEYEMFMTPTISNKFVCSNVIRAEWQPYDQEKISISIPAFKQINKRDIAWVNQEDLDLHLDGLWKTVSSFKVLACSVSCRLVPVFCEM